MSTASDDQRVEVMLGHLLRIGVVISAAVAAIGGVVYVSRHGGEEVHYQTFGDGTPQELRKPSGVIDGVRNGSGRALVQLGLLLLIATPVARVAFSAVAFLRQRDWMYTAMTVFVLVVLLFSLFHAGG